MTTHDATKYSNDRELFALLIFTILPCPIVWYGLTIIQSSAWAVFLYHGLCLVPVTIWGRKLWQNDLKWPSLPQWLFLLCSAGLTTAAALIVYAKLGDYILSSPNTLELLLRLGYSRSTQWVMSIYFIVINALLEELFWRGVILNKIQQLKPTHKYLAIVWSSIGYGAFHYSILRLIVYPGWAEFGTFMLMLYGGVLALMYRRTKSILIPFLAHALTTDLIVIVLIYALFHRMNFIPY